MTRDEALQLLGLPDNANEDAVRAKYGELYNDHQLRLTNAPTPNLKKLYQKNLEELNEALQTVLGGGAATVLKELPSSAPVYDAGSSAPPPARATAQRPAPAAKKAAAKGGASWGLVTGLGIGLVTAITAAAYFGLRHLDDQKELDELRPLTTQVEQLNGTIAAKDAYAEQYAPAKFKLRNTGTQPFQLFAMIATYKDENGRIVKFEDVLNLDVRSGGTVEPTKVNGGRVIWDGSATAFTCMIIRPGRACPIIHAGILSNEQKDGAVNLNFDNW